MNPPPAACREQAQSEKTGMLAQGCLRIQSPGENAGFAMFGNWGGCRIFVLRKLRPIPMTGFGDESFLRGMCGAQRTCDSSARESCAAARGRHFAARVTSLGLS